MLARALGYDTVHLTCQANGYGGWAHEMAYVHQPLFMGSDQRRLSNVADRLFIADPNEPSIRQKCKFVNNDNYTCLSCIQQFSNTGCRLPPTTGNGGGKPEPPSYE